MIASLMMYHRAETAAAHKAYWSMIRAGLARRQIPAPAALSNDAPEFDVWCAPELVLSQTCSLPYRARLAERVTLVGTPDFGLPNCPPGYYNSVVVVREDENRTDLSAFADARFAYNQSLSQSGFAAIYALAEAQGIWFPNRIESGAHGASARMVARVTPTSPPLMPRPGG